MGKVRVVRVRLGAQGLSLDCHCMCTTQLDLLDFNKHMNLADVTSKYPYLLSNSHLSDLGPGAMLFVPIKNSYSFFPALHSWGRSIPTLLAVSLTLSSSSISIPGLYLSSRVAYILCALTYWIYCSASSTWGVALACEEKVVRMRC